MTGDLDELAADLVGRRDLRSLVPVLGRIRDAIQRLDGRLSPIEARLLVVDQLPDNAPFGALIRVRGDQTGTLYLGNGGNKPLAKLVPSAV